MQKEKRLGNYWEFFGSMCNFNMTISDWKLVVQKIDSVDLDEIDIEMASDKSENSNDFFSEIFPDIHRKSYLVTLLILFEHELKSICDLFFRIENHKIRQVDLKGSNIERFRTYLDKLVQITIEYDIGLYNLVLGIIELRNCIVHSNSLLTDFSRKNQIIDLSKKIDGLIINAEYITVSLEFCLNCADVINKFIDVYYKAALDRYPEEKG